MKLSNNEPISNSVEIQYFNWLCKKIGGTERILRHYIMVGALHKKEFYWTVPNDDNRGADGKQLREKFAEVSNYIPYDALDGPCTMLEMLIALAGRFSELIAEAEDDTDEGLADCFWEMINNVGLDYYTDSMYIVEGDTTAIDSKLDKVLERTYSRAGSGGLFPLKRAKKDQRKIEIWYQLAAYLNENYYSNTTE